MSLETTGQVAPFHFFLEIGKYSGLSAASYEDFLRKIKQVRLESLNFHLERGDFERWVADILKDKKLTEKIAKMRHRKLRGPILRIFLSIAVSNRLKELADTTCTT